MGAPFTPKCFTDEWADIHHTQVSLCCPSQSDLKNIFKSYMKTHNISLGQTLRLCDQRANIRKFIWLAKFEVDCQENLALKTYARIKKVPLSFK